MGAEDPNMLVAVEFEVYGQVQGCFFTKYCKELAEQLDICGWVKNTKKGTIVGKIQGTKANLDHITVVMRAARGRPPPRRVHATHADLRKYRSQLLDIRQLSTGRENQWLGATSRARASSNPIDIYTA